MCLDQGWKQDSTTEMNKPTILLLALALTALQIDAKKSKKHKPKEETEVMKSEDGVETEEEPVFRSYFPGFAIRIPVPNFGILSNIRERLDNLFSGKQPEGLSDFVPGDKAKYKTTTKTKNSTRGPFKTYTVTQETVSTDNKSSPHVVSKIFKSLTTLDKDKLLSKGKNGKIKIPSMQFELGPFGPAFEDVKGEPVGFCFLFTLSFVRYLSKESDLSVKVWVIFIDPSQFLVLFINVSKRNKLFSCANDDRVMCLLLKFFQRTAKAVQYFGIGAY